MLRCEWLSGDRLMRNYFASATIAPGKSSLFLAEAIAVAPGRDLPGTAAPALQGVVLERREPGRRN
jgi:hypothetical protein